MIQILMKLTLQCPQINLMSSGLFDLKRTFGHHFAGSFFMLLTFFKLLFFFFFKKIFQEHYQSVKRFGFRPGPTFCRS